MCSVQFLLTEELCNAAYSRVDDVVLLSITHIYPTFCSCSPFHSPPFTPLHPDCPFTALQVLLDQSTKANSPLKGHERTVQYLQRLGKAQRPTQICFNLISKLSSLLDILNLMEDKGGGGDFGKTSEKPFTVINWECWIKHIIVICRMFCSLW